MEAGPEEPRAPRDAAQSADPAERLDGLRAWVAQLDRKLGTRFYALGAATVLGLAAGIVAIVLVLGLKEDSATKSQIEQLRDDVRGVERSASTAADDDVAALDERLAGLESQLEGLRSDQTATGREISVIQDDVSDLRDDVTQLENAPPPDTSDSTNDSAGGSNSNSP